MISAREGKTERRGSSGNFRQICFFGELDAACLRPAPGSLFFSFFSMVSMSSVADSSPLNPSVSALFLLISAEIDGDLTPAEATELRLLESRFPEESRVFRSKCVRLRSNLQKLPVVSARVQVSRPSGFSFRRTASVAATLVACGLLMVLLLRPLQRGRPVDGVVTAAPASPEIVPSASADGFVAAFPGDVALPMAAAGAPAPAPGAPGGFAAARPAAAEEKSDVAANSVLRSTDKPIQTLLTEQDWNVVVVRVRSGSPEDVLKELRSLLSRHGLELARSQPTTMPEWLGVFLPASIPARQKLLDEVQQSLTVDPPEWDPAEIMRSSRESILAAVRQSLSSPTRSELIRGELFVAVSPQSVKAPAAMAGTRDEDQPSISRTASLPESTQPKDPGTMLLVFQFAEDGGPVGPRKVF